jgi:hypothetical protein
MHYTIIKKSIVDILLIVNLVNGKYDNNKLTIDDFKNIIFVKDNFDLNICYRPN